MISAERDLIFLRIK